MTSQIMTFRQLLAPVDPEEFLNDYYGKKPLYIPGSEDKFAEIFSWDRLNDLLCMSTLWSDRSFELARNGRMLRPEEYCYPGINREGGRALKPNVAKVQQHLREGATLALDFIELLTPELRSLAQTLESVTGAQVCASAFCSWHKTQGYSSHFDVQNVFACHFAGTKTWRIFEGRLPGAADLPGGHRDHYPQEQHERMKGAVLQDVVMTPGDLLYIPHGQYHDALSSSEACLHVSFGSIHLVAHDFLQALMKDLPRDPVFREHLPHIDDIGAYEGYLGALAERLSGVMTQPVIAQQLREFIRHGAFERRADFNLPDRGETPSYRVIWHGRRLNDNDNGTTLTTGNSTVPLDPSAAELGRWIIVRDIFTSAELTEAFPTMSEASLDAGLNTLKRAGLVEAI